MIIVHTYIPYLIVSMVFGWGVAFLVTRLSIAMARRYDVLARPDHRASHSIPTPRLGGLGIVAALYGHAALLDAQGFFAPAPWKSALLVGGAWAFVGGLLDDFHQLNPRWKFLFQFAAAGSAAVLGFRVLPAPFAAWLDPLSDSWFEIAAGLFTVLFIVFVMNAYNFMDGMDGQAAVFGTLVAVAMALPSAALVVPDALGEVVMLGTLAGALLGFFMYNRPSAPVGRKTFMGDCGSQFVGYALALMALRCEQTSYDVFNFWSALIILSPFLWDVTYTLIRRLLRGENILTAHRTHLYQRLLVAGWSHTEALALNFMLWGMCFVLAQLHARLLREGARGWLALVYCAVAFVLLCYTLFVLMVERQAKRRAQRDATSSQAGTTLTKSA
jgi:UDP-N-acetylmuramyl pentapeptide phosphotransferase/UDP-N-acetylglucosamine-1-phosphate transferase